MAHILIVEPDSKLARLYAGWLEQAGHSTGWASTAQAAITAADEQRPDVVVLEIQLTNHSGIEFLYEFRSYTDWQTIPVVVTSHVPEATFAPHIRALKERLGVRCYLYKPALTLHHLGRVIDTTLATGSPA